MYATFSGRYFCMKTEDIIKNEIKARKHAWLVLIFSVATIWYIWSGGTRWWIVALLMLGTLWNLAVLEDRDHKDL